MKRTWSTPAPPVHKSTAENRAHAIAKGARDGLNTLWRFPGKPGHYTATDGHRIINIPVDYTGPEVCRFSAAVVIQIRSVLATARGWGTEPFDARSLRQEAEALGKADMVLGQALLWAPYVVEALRGARGDVQVGTSPIGALFVRADGEEHYVVGRKP